MTESYKSSTKINTDIIDLYTSLPTSYMFALVNTSSTMKYHYLPAWHSHVDTLLHEPWDDATELNNASSWYVDEAGMDLDPYTPKIFGWSHHYKASTALDTPP